MTGIPQRLRASLIPACALALLQACDTSTTVQSLPSDSNVSTSVPKVPGTDADIAEPTQIDNKTCSEEANAKVTLNYYNTIGRWPNDGGNDFVLFWTVCNMGKQQQAAGSSYDFVLEIENDDTQSPNPPTFTPFKTQSIPIPALGPCLCYVQEVGINMDVDSTVPQQPNIQGLGAVFPRFDPPANAPPDGGIAHQYRATLSSTAGLSVPNGIRFPIN